ncbi:16S rRNA (guanine(966)-N(2))-methyltransferase RsmD [Rhodanobacter sp. Root627]|uniref:16S rRNA (guanine(966)-N(2))-methyltransferase RsmD n=1 Tax=Rhodanobacter sp. Root627 TaxID=1736572 RepID=UPI0019101706
MALVSAARHGAPGRIRIIGGNLRNSRLDVADMPGLRPTAERLRETLFNWLAPTIAGARVLDLCAGTGALGIEALSRGAASVQFVEREARVARAIEQNLARLKQAGGAVAATDAEAFLRGTGRPHDLVLLDPPFALGLWEALAQQLEQGGWLATAALIYVESPRAVTPTLPPNWQLQRESHAGDARGALYRRA